MSLNSNRPCSFDSISRLKPCRLTMRTTARRAGLPSGIAT